MRSRYATLVLIGLFFSLAAEPAHSSPSHETAVVRILNHAQDTSAYTPWSGKAPHRSTGTGFVIPGGLVLTNAHVVSDTRALFILLDGDSTPHEARVRFAGHDCDLALVEPVEPGLLDRITPLRFGPLPEIGSPVETLGYSAGGQRISRTEGIVSRIEVNQFVHSGADYHITAQTDAAINAGNSGGPVLQAGRVVGVAFQTATALENVGFFIPPEVVEHFLKDVSDGRYDGYPDLGITTASLENPAARQRAQMRHDESGVQVIEVRPGSSGSAALEIGDVILEVDGYKIENDKTYSEGDLRLHFAVLLDRHQNGGTCRLVVLREGKRLTLDVEMNVNPIVDRYRILYDELPRYYVYAGLVFVPLNREMLMTYGEGWLGEADKLLINAYAQQGLKDPEWVLRESVVLLRRLDHPVNAGMAWYKNQLVDRINGRSIDKLEDVIAAFDEGTEQFHLIEFGYHGRFGVLEREAAEQAHEEVLELYGVPKDRRL